MSTQVQPPESKEQLKTSSDHVNAQIVRKQQRAPRSRMDLVVLWLAVFLLALLVLVGVIDSAPLHSVQNNAAADNSGSNSSSGQATTGTTSKAAVPAHQTYNPQLPPVLQGSTVNISLTITEQLVTIADGVAYHAWTFGGTVPGPILHVRQGQLVHTTIINHGNMAHSIDLHAAQTPWSVSYQDIPVGKSLTFTWRADHPGVFMYHCGTAPVIDHIASGMYGTIIVDPAISRAPAKEYVLVQSEFYTAQNSDGTYSLDTTKVMNDQPDYVAFNGYANQYKAAPLTAKAGERIRLYILNAGPSEFSAFHVIGAILSDAYMDGNPANRTQGNQTVMVPPGGGTIVELVIPAAGLYPFVTHSFADASKGAMGMIKVTP
ncbi:MAG: multicopper oxidase domain-containing protein [Chloroflexota bacterium]|nr:multicopper oxidase domain-containing protein [Chloroflexota bacterium]